jgi:hypothetical protein
VSDSLDPSSVTPDPVNPGDYIISAKNYTKTVTGTVTFTYATISGTLQLYIFAPTGVLQVETHEWVPDPALTAADVLSSVFGITGLSGAAALDALAQKGYPAYLDGYLDYLEFTFNDNIVLDLACVMSVSYSDPTGSFNRSWGVYNVVPVGVAAGNPAARYRLWLRPSGVVDPGATLETGLEPLIMFVSDRVDSLNPSVGGAGGLYETTPGITHDSAAPVVAAYKLYDNICQGDSAPVVEVLMSEAISSVSTTPTLSSIETALDRRNPDGSRITSVSDGSFTSVALVEIENGLTGQYAGYSFELEPDSASLFMENASAVRLNVSGISNHMPRDAFGNHVNGRPNREVALTHGQGSPDVVCDLTMTSTADVWSAFNLAWSWVTTPEGGSENVPLFPWWGITLVNPCRGIPIEQCPDGSHQIYIWDVLGNVVADPETNASLKVILKADVLWADGKKSITIGLEELRDYLINNNSSAVYPLFWNGLNNRGRRVAPGGYIIKRTIFDGVNKPVVVHEKLIFKNPKR